MTWLNPALVYGLVAAAAPIIIHIAHRRKVKQLDWGAMRFLLEMFARSRRRLFIEEWLLMLIRILILALFVMALWRPVLQHDRPAGALTIERRGRVASVVLVDDSVSTRAGRRKTRMDSMKELAVAYIDSLSNGDDVSIIRLSQMDQPQADPIFDLDGARELIRAVEPTDIASDVPSLIEAGLAQLGKHINPSAEIVLVTDGFDEGWRTDDRARWAEIARRVREAGNRRGSQPSLILLGPEPDAEIDNLAVTDLRFDRALVAAGSPVTVRVEVRHRGKRRPEHAFLRLQVDGRTVDERPLEMKEAGGRSQFSFQHAFSEPGSHVVEAVVQGGRDVLGHDDRRALSAEVTRSMPVLLVEGVGPEGGDQRGLDGSLGFVAAALDPEGEGSGLFAVERVSLAELARVRFSDYKAVVLGDVPALDAPAVAELERYVVSGGGVLVGVGPHTDGDVVNRFWARNGDGFLPAPLAAAVEPDAPAIPATADVGHPALCAFEGAAFEAWKAGKVRRHFKLDSEGASAGDLGRLLVLDSGEPLLVERRRGMGRVALFTTSLDMSWSDMPVQAAFVPLLRGVVGYLGSTTQPPRNLAAGDRITHVMAVGEGRPTAETGEGVDVPLEAGSWEGRLAFVSKPLCSAGVYRVHEPNETQARYYIVGLGPDESRLTPMERDIRDRAVGPLDPVVLSSVQGIREAIDPKAGQRVELWRWLLAASLALLFAETLFTRRQSIAEHRIGAGGSPGREAAAQVAGGARQAEHELEPGR